MYGFLLLKHIFIVNVSGSDWETDVSESCEPHDVATENHSAEETNASDSGVLVVESEATSFSYSSILKRSSKVAAAPSAQQQQSSATATPLKIDKSARGAGVGTKVKQEEEKKKFTTKTPITFDLLVAVAPPRKNKVKKAEQRVAPRLPTVVTVRNALDSSAPQRKRGKEREGGKKKRKTVLKKTILAERARKRELREAAEQRKIFATISIKKKCD